MPARPGDTRLGTTEARRGASRSGCLRVATEGVPVPGWCICTFSGLRGCGGALRGGLAYALAEFLAGYRDGFPEGRHAGLYLVQVIVRVILGAVVGAATLALGQSAAFVSGLAGPAALVALGARFGRRRTRPGGREAADATDRPDAKARR